MAASDLDGRAPAPERVRFGEKDYWAMSCARNREDVNELQKDRREAFGLLLPFADQTTLHAPLAQTARQEIVYRDVRRLTYLELRDRIGRLGSALHKIGVKDDRWGERPLALIGRDPKTMPPVSEEEIKAHVLSYSEKKGISKFAVLQKILFVEALAKTSVGAPNTVAHDSRWHA